MSNFDFSSIAFIVVLAVWWLAGYVIIHPDKFGYVTRFGKFRGTKKPGLRHSLWPIDKITKLPASGQQAPFSRIGIATKEENYLGKTRDEAIIGADTVLNYQFPDDDSIKKTIEYLGDPPDINRLVDLIEEPTLTMLRSEGKEMCWLQLMIDRDFVSKRVLEKISKNASNPLTLSTLKNTSLSIKHLDIPEKLLGSINEPAIQRILMEASKSEAERERILRAGKGKGDAEARKAIFKIAKEHPELEQLLTLREMAQGQSTTIFVPKELLNALESYTGKPLGSNEEITSLLKQILGKLPA